MSFACYCRRDRLEEAAQLRTSIESWSDLPMRAYITNRELRTKLVAWIATALLSSENVPHVPAGCTLVVDAEGAFGTAHASGTAPPHGTAAYENQFGEADCAMYAHVVHAPGAAVIASRDSDAIVNGLLASLRRADPATGALQRGPWWVHFAVGSMQRKLVELDALWDAILTKPVRAAVAASPPP